jgi:hypothetical protein
MGQSKEHYNAKPMAANAVSQMGVSIAGFLCTVAGTLTVTDADGTVLVNALPVAVGPFHPNSASLAFKRGRQSDARRRSAGTLFTLISKKGERA